MSQRQPSLRGLEVQSPCAFRSTFLAAFVALAVATAACKGGSNAAGSAAPGGPALPVKVQCDKLVQTVQQGRAKFEAVQDSADFDKDTRRSVSLLQELRDDIGKSNAQDAGLKKIATDYQAALSLAATDLSALAGAAKASDEKKVDTLSTQFDAHRKAASVIDKRLTDYCANK